MRRSQVVPSKEGIWQHCKLMMTETSQFEWISLPHDFARACEASATQEATAVPALLSHTGPPVQVNSVCDSGLALEQAGQRPVGALSASITADGATSPAAKRVCRQQEPDHKRVCVRHSYELNSSFPYQPGHHVSFKVVDVNAVDEHGNACIQLMCCGERRCRQRLGQGVGARHATLDRRARGGRGRAGRAGEQGGRRRVASDEWRPRRVLPRPWRRRRPPKKVGRRAWLVAQRALGTRRASRAYPLAAYPHYNCTPATARASGFCQARGRREVLLYARRAAQPRHCLPCTRYYRTHRT